MTANIALNPSYTVRGQLSGVGWPGGSTSYTYLLEGKVNAQYRTNGVTTTYGYDGWGMIGWVRHTSDSNGRDLAKRDYWRDNRDRIVAWKGDGHRDEFDGGWEWRPLWLRSGGATDGGII